MSWENLNFLLYYIPLAWSYPTIWLLTLVSVKPKNLLLGFTDIANNFIKSQTNWVVDVEEANGQKLIVVIVAYET